MYKTNILRFLEYIKILSCHLPAFFYFP